MVKINKDACIGCGSCTMLAPDVFDFSDDGLACVKENINVDNDNEAVNEAIENCPTSAIYKD